MKKYVGIALAALVAFSACTKVERDPMPASKISFVVGDYAHRTKADPAAGHTLFSDVSTTFNSRAFLYGAGVSGVQHFFGTGDGEVVEFDGTNAWAPGAVSGKEYYWPFSSESYINFVCWYDKNGTPSVHADSLDETQMHWLERTIVADDEIMFADEAWRYNNNDNAQFLYEASAGVPVLFHHALAQVGFRARIKSGCDVSTSGMTRWEVSISDVALSNVYNTGTLNLSNTDPDSRTIVPWTVDGGNWTDLDDAASVEIAGTSQVALNASSETVLQAPRTVLPQPVNNNMMLTFNYRISSYRGNSETPFSVEYMSFSGSLKAFTPEIEAWGLGQRIIYTIVIDPSTDTILFDPSLTDWVAGEGGGVTVE
ncbi:MAG: fimbrillin family protein [Bacteroidales bacterium]|nr:fimbrillin family protein [Bacteroidales bacterium]